MLRRFKRDTQSYEFIVKFEVTVEKTDESTISMAGNTPADIIDMKERRRYLRKEMREHVNADTFYAAKRNVDHELMDRMLEVVTKANQALNAHELLAIDNYYEHEETVADLKRRCKEAKKGDDAHKLAKAAYDAYKERHLVPDQEPK